MTGCPETTRHGRQAALGAVVALALVWLGVVGFYLYRRDWNDALFWAAIALATSAGSWAAVAGSGRRR